MPKIKSRRQLKADKQREQHKVAAEKERQRLSDNATRLKNMVGGFARSDTPTPEKKSSLLNPRPYQRSTPKIESVKPDLPTVAREAKPTLSPEMLQREKIAQAEIERKKKRIGVLYNKGAYQYISDGMDLTTLGKK